MAREVYPAPYVAISPLAPPVDVCRRHGDRLIKQGEAQGIKIDLVDNTNPLAQCQSCVNEATTKEKNNAESAFRSEGQEG